jgi:hypothetical protein
VGENLIKRTVGHLFPPQGHHNAMAMVQAKLLG